MTCPLTLTLMVEITGVRSSLKVEDKEIADSEIKDKFEAKSSHRLVFWPPVASTSALYLVDIFRPVN